MKVISCFLQSDNMNQCLIETNAAEIDLKNLFVSFTNEKQKRSYFDLHALSQPAQIYSLISV